ncbi:MAG: type II secretion system protein [Piscirickettsiaceae bacterium]|nr:type II secretion system protein [Piscirickettsiaceae bacterium]
MIFQIHCQGGKSDTNDTLKIKQQGFTLIELVIVMIVGSIMAMMTTSILTGPVQSYVDITRRATLTDAAESALRRMQRDIRRALPNSIRLTNSGRTLELLHISAGGRYRAKLASDASGDILDFTRADTRFDIIGTLNASPSGDVVIYNLGSASADAYAGDNRASIATSTVNTITLSSAKKFPLSSPQQRFFIIDTPITYHCDLANNELLRYDNYAIELSSPSLGNASLQSNNISACKFDYDDGTSSRTGLVTLTLTLTDDASESITLIHQAHVDNQP